MEHQQFFITQSAIIVNKKGQILILCHNSEPERWLLPGGKIVKGESWLEGLRSEVKEETGISKFKIDNILDVSSWIESQIGYYVVTFLCSTLLGQKIVLSDEHKDFIWVSLDDVERYTFWHPDIKKRILKAFFEMSQNLKSN